MNKQKDKELSYEELFKKSDEYLNGWKRALADYHNLERETEKKKSEWLKMANEDLLFELLPIYDHLKLAWAHIPAEQKKTDWVVGIEHIKNQMKKFLETQGIEEIQTIGQKFDPTLHEAVEHKDAESAENTSTDAGQGDTESHNEIIKKEIRAGYKLNGKVIQAAKVIV